MPKRRRRQPSRPRSTRAARVRRRNSFSSSSRSRREKTPPPRSAQPKKRRKRPRPSASGRRPSRKPKSGSTTCRRLPQERASPIDRKGPPSGGPGFRTGAVMLERFRRLQRDERGMTLMFVAVGLTTFLAASTLAIDVGMFMTAKSQAQNAADAGALAGATALAVNDYDDRTA